MKDAPAPKGIIYISGKIQLINLDWFVRVKSSSPWFVG